MAPAIRRVDSMVRLKRANDGRKSHLLVPADKNNYVIRDIISDKRKRRIFLFKRIKEKGVFFFLKRYNVDKEKDVFFFLKERRNETV